MYTIVKLGAGEVARGYSTRRELLHDRMDPDFWHVCNIGEGVFME